MVSLPPGITEERALVERHSGGIESWLEYEKIKLYTNAFIKEEGKVNHDYIGLFIQPVD